MVAHVATVAFLGLDAREQRLARNDFKTAVAELQCEIDNLRQAWATATRLRQLVSEGKLKVVAAMHDISTGKVSWMS